MAIDPAVIGSRTPVFSTEAERGRLRFFAQACGQTDPVYSDLRAAEAAGHRDLPVPPTFLFCLEMDNPDRARFLTELGVDVRTVLHGGQEFTYHATAYAGRPSRSRPRSRTSTRRRAVPSSSSCATPT